MLYILVFFFHTPQNALYRHKLFPLMRAWVLDILLLLIMLRKIFHLVRRDATVEELLGRVKFETNWIWRLEIAECTDTPF